ncbi:GIY-YIG nuclease family protein [Streptomyces spiralis]|uniref:GIY-YIG nuclease family protein n=1 Tax=Streptomyces spiralis TaxID=66376 RepID=UPI003358E9AD
MAHARRGRYHYRGNAAGSTLRLTLGCLFGLELRRVGSGTRLTFGRVGEARLSQWMAANA